MPSSPACTTISSPLSNSTSDRFRCLAGATRSPAGELGHHRRAARTRRGTCRIRRRRTRKRGAWSRPRAASCVPGRDRDVEVPRIRGDAVDRSLLAPELAADDPHARTVIVDHLGDVGRSNVLIARRCHLERPREVRPQLKPVHPAAAGRLSASPGGECRYRPSSTARRRRRACRDSRGCRRDRRFRRARR